MAATAKKGQATGVPARRAQADLESRRPLEVAVSEGNLAELPIFVLSNKDARPYVKDAFGKKVIDPKDYIRLHELGIVDVEGQFRPRNVVIKASAHAGFPTMFAHRVLLVLMEAAREQSKFYSPFVRISRHEILQRLDYSDPSAKDYRQLLDALDAMKDLSLVFHNSWYAKGAEANPQGEVRSDGLIASYSFTDERQRALPFADGKPPAVDGEPPEGSYVKLADLVLESLRRGYYNGIDLRYLNHLNSPLAESLYIYLTKKDHNRRVWVEDIRSIGKKVGLKKRAPSDIWDSLEPALKLLTQPLDLKDGKPVRRFLADFRYVREKNQVAVLFFSTAEEQLKASLPGGVPEWEPAPPAQGSLPLPK